MKSVNPQFRMQKAIAMGLDPETGSIPKSSAVVDKKKGGKIKSKEKGVNHG